MRKRSLDVLGLGWQPPRRVLLFAGALAALLVLAGSVAWWTGSHQSPEASGKQTSPTGAPRSPLLPYRQRPQEGPRSPGRRRSPIHSRSPGRAR